MAKDYYSVLVRATAALDPGTEEARRALYDRARLAIMDAGLSAEQTSAERAALEDAIERVEAGVAQAEHGRSAGKPGDDARIRCDRAERGAQATQTSPSRDA